MALSISSIISSGDSIAFGARTDEFDDLVFRPIVPAARRELERARKLVGLDQPIKMIAMIADAVCPQVLTGE